ncbi:MAG TPA: hypothetical protein VIJ92_13835 [Ginsengibacter sp.]
MKEEDLDFIKEKHKWPFVWTDIFGRYFILIAPLFFIFLSFMISYFSIKRDTDFSFLLVAIPIFLFGCFAFFLILKRLESERQFKTILFERQHPEFENYFTDLGWKLSSKTDKVIIGETKISWFSWGETITIVLGNKELLFNSRPQGRQPFTFNRDKVNYKKFCNEISIT